MRISKALMIFVLMTIAAFVSNRTRYVAAVNSPPNVLSSEKEAEVRVNSVEIFAWWGNEQKKYVKLERWKDTTDPRIPHPQRFDLICHLENVSDSSLQHGHYLALVTMDFIFAPTYLHKGDVNKIMDEVSWVREGFDELKTEVVPFIAFGEKSQIKIENVSLEGILKKFDGAEDALWPWALKATVHILDRDLVRVAQGQAILPMIPSDKRLAIK